jgi:hypothetical protein
MNQVDFTLSVLTKTLKKVRLEGLPARTVKIVPEYKGYRFFVLADGQIVVVVPML